MILILSRSIKPFGPIRPRDILLISNLKGDLCALQLTMNTFAEIGLRDELVRAVTEMGFEQPTPIQAEAIPHLLSSEEDLTALAQTGTGKTAAFGLPTIHLTDIGNKNTQTIILCPTRELCIQIAKDLAEYSKFLKGLRIVSVYGGASIDRQIKALNSGAQIVVGTPGRTVDLIKRKKLKLGNIERVILDEADEMLSMGFQEDLDFILDQTPDHKQTLLFSATISKEVSRIAKRYMTNPLEIQISKTNSASKNVSHVYFQVHAKDKYEVLKRVADMNPNIYGIVFCRTRRETKEIANKLMSDGYNADALHGDLSQAQRDEVMGTFRNRVLQLLVATDVAARGLDVNDLSHVINYHLPDDIESYVHRSGRTGRAGKSGVSMAIIHSREQRKIRDIEKHAGIKFKHEKVPTGQDICRKQLYNLIDKVEKVEVDKTQIDQFMPEIYAKLEWLSREDLIKHFVSVEFNRFLSYYKGSRDLNDNRPAKKEKDRKERATVREKRERTQFTRMYINVGSKNKLSPARLIGLINEGLDSGDAPVGKIEIMRNLSFFEIEDKFAQPLIKGLEGSIFERIPVEIEVSHHKESHNPPVREKMSKSYRKGSDSSSGSSYGGRKRRGKGKEDWNKGGKGRKGRRR